ncbi:MAG TPA: NAD(P)(+) transhydrogenase (Re/Si-specific) subunit alpha, partial [Lautropia sp.]|nr:NAD(P)(+) transhydrogenase (Re/Si-specific) subunit alpha [Lautropia sp.]
MRIGVPRERRAGETRVAATPETVKKLVAAGHEVLVETEAGVAASQPDSAYVEAGAKIVAARDAFTTEMVVKVRPPLADELATLQAGTVLVGMLNPHDAEGLQKLAATGASAF